MNKFVSVMRRAVGIAALAATLAIPAHAEDTLRVGKAFIGSFAYALVDVGVQQGIFARNGLKLDISAFEGGAKLQQAMAADAVDIGLSGGTDMVLTQKGAPMRAVGVIMVGAEMVAIVAPDSKFKTAADLKGSRWPAPSKASMPGWLPVALSLKQGWGADGVSIVGGPPPNQAMALIKRGELHAMTMDPASALGLQAKGEMRIILDFGDYAPSFIQYAVFATDKAIKDKPKAVASFMKAWGETITYAKANKDETVKIITPILGVPEEFVAATYDRTIKRYSEDGRFDAATVDVMKTTFITSGMADAVPDMKALYTEDFLPKR